MNTIISILVSEVKLLLTGLRNALMDSYIFSVLYKRIHFSLPLNPAIHRMGGQHTKYSVPQMQRTKIVSTLFYIVLQTF